MEHCKKEKTSSGDDSERIKERKMIWIVKEVLLHNNNNNDKTRQIPIQLAKWRSKGKKTEQKKIHMSSCLCGQE